MKLHANARTCPHSRRLTVDRVEVEGWTLARGGRGRRRERAHGLEVAAPLPRAKASRGCWIVRSAPASVPLRTDEARVAVIAALRRLRMTARRDRRDAGDAGLDGLGDLDPDRAGQALAAGAARAAEPLREARGRASSSTSTSRSSAGSDGRAIASTATVAPVAAGSAGSTSTSRSTTRPARLRRGARRREGRDRGRLPAPRRRALRRLRDPRRATDDRQRQRLPLRDPRACLQALADQTPPHPPLPAADEREGRTLHPHHARRLGLRRHLPHQRRTPPRTHRLARLLQSTTFRRTRADSAHKRPTSSGPGAAPSARSGRGSRRGRRRSP